MILGRPSKIHYEFCGLRIRERRTERLPTNRHSRRLTQITHINYSKPASQTNCNVYFSTASEMKHTHTHTLDASNEIMVLYAKRTFMNYYYFV